MRAMLTLALVLLLSACASTAPSLRPGQQGIIRLSSATEYPLSQDRQTYEALARAIDNHDNKAVAAIMSRGSARLAPDGSYVLVTAVDRDLIEVEVRDDGIHYGTRGWLPAHLVRPR
jgi:hypothetical protein